jgi:hypothetical protein
VAFSACWSAECSRVAAERVGKALGWNERQRMQALDEFEQERQGFLQPPALEQLRATAASALPFTSVEDRGQQPRIV